MGKQTAKPNRTEPTHTHAMKRFLRTLPALLFLGLPAARSADTSRADINPALLYYQGFALSPAPPEADVNRIHSIDWRGHPFDTQTLALLGQYDNAVRLYSQAVQCTPPCDWGYDLSQGPDLLMPGLARAKGAAQAIRLRVRWHLEQGRQEKACEDFIAGVVLGRNTGRGGLLIGALVGYAIEGIQANALAENFASFTPASLARIRDGIQSAPVRTTLHDCMAVEESAILGWFIKQVRDIQADAGGNEAEALARIKALFTRVLTSEEQNGKGPEATATRFLEYADKSTEGVIRRLEEMRPLYRELTDIQGLPYPDFEAAGKAFKKVVDSHPNPLVAELIPAVQNSRVKQSNAEVRTAMSLAAIARQLNGAEGLSSIQDPCGKGPFALEPLIAGGVEAGFILRSKLVFRGFPESMAFPTKPAVAVQTDGADAGKALPSNR